MKHTSAHDGMLILWLVFLPLAPASAAEIYKWVDANGKTHYSERKVEANNAKPVALKALPQPASALGSQGKQINSSPTEYWQDRERQFKQRQIRNHAKTPSATIASTKPKSLSGGKDYGSDASRCDLARDIVSGAVKHSNGKPTDAYDLEVAQSDLRTFCQQ